MRAPRRVASTLWAIRVAGRPGHQRVDAEWPERLQREHGFDRHVEEPRDPEREVQARGVLAALEVDDGLVVDPERLGEVRSRQAAVRPEKRQPIVDQLAL